MGEGASSARNALKGEGPLGPEFYARPVARVARELVGCVLRHGDTAGVIVETEAYHDTEPASHGYTGLSARNHVLFGLPGIAYVYRSYGIHALFNTVAEPEGVGAGVLIRALEPREGIEIMRMRRGAVPDGELCSGPGKLSQALGIGLELSASPLTGAGPVHIEGRPCGRRRPRLAVGPRVGITKATDLPWRFALAGSPWVSRPHLPARAGADRAPRSPG